MLNPTSTVSNTLHNRTGKQKGRSNPRAHKKTLRRIVRTCPRSTRLGAATTRKRKGDIEDQDVIRSDTCAIPHLRLMTSLPFLESCNLDVATSDSAEDCNSYVLSDNEALLSSLKCEFIEVDKLS